MASEKGFLRNTLGLLAYNTHSGNEAIMHKALTSILKRLQFNVEIDDIGNVYATRGEAILYPLLNAHIDIVSSYDVKRVKPKATKVVEKKKEIITKTTEELPTETTHCKDCEDYYTCLKIHMENEKMRWLEAKEDFDQINFANYCRDFKRMEQYDYTSKLDSATKHYSAYDYCDYEAYTGVTWAYPRTTYKYDRTEIDKIINAKFEISYNKTLKKITSNGIRILGGDDKCGIAIALQAAIELPTTPMKLLFTVQEESGCVGIKHFVKHNSDWFNDVGYSITIDRKGGDNLLLQSCSKNNCTPEFASLIALCAMKAGIMPKVMNGSIADVMHIRDFCEAVNISAGYYDAHTLQEHIQFDEMILIKEWVKNIIVDL